MKRPIYAWLSLLLGILTVILAVYMLLIPVSALGAAIIFLSIMVLAEGLLDVYLFFRMRRIGGISPAFLLVSGILLTIVSILMFLNVVATAMVISLLLPIFFIIRCVARLANLGLVKRFAGNGMFYLLLILNVLGIVLGVILLLNPVSTLAAIPFVFAFYLMVLGIESIATFFSGLGGIDQP